MLAKELRKHLQSGKLDPIFLIHGEENYFSDESVRLLIDQVVQEEDRSFLVGHFDLEEGDLSSALAQARTVRGRTRPARTKLVPKRSGIC